jgi:isoquinoline 1-oxidoreductase subunit beta
MTHAPTRCCAKLPRCPTGNASATVAAWASPFPTTTAACLPVDPGLAVQPTNVLAQLEGAAVFGLSVALIEELTIKNGAPVQSNFNDYPVLRMSDMPEIHTKLVKSDAAPTGMGEIGVLPVAPAIANAIFQLTGKRLRALPMSPDRVKRALA